MSNIRRFYLTVSLIVIYFCCANFFLWSRIFNIDYTATNSHNINANVDDDDEGKLQPSSSLYTIELEPK